MQIGCGVFTMLASRCEPGTHPWATAAAMSTSKSAAHAWIARLKDTSDVDKVSLRGFEKLFFERQSCETSCLLVFAFYVAESAIGAACWYGCPPAQGYDALVP